MTLLSLLKQDWRAQSLKWLMLALFFSIFWVCLLVGVTDALQGTLLGKSREFLAADRTLKSAFPISDTWIVQAKKDKLKVAQTLNFQSMLFAGDEPTLVAVKAADVHYPLLGFIQYRKRLDQPIEKIQQVPQQGHVWLDSQLFAQLDLQINDTVDIGEASFVVSKVLVAEPDRVSSFSVGGKVLMSLGDVEKTQIIGPGSRLSYHYLFAGSANNITKFENWLKPQLEDRHSWLGIEDAQPAVAKALQRAQNYFLLASSVVVVLASLALAIASMQYAAQQVEQVALLKTLGLTRQRILRLSIARLLLVYLVVYVIACGLAHSLQHELLKWLGASYQIAVAEVGLRSWFIAGFVSFLSLLLFTLPQVVKLASIPAMRILNAANTQWQFGRVRLLLAALGLFLVLLVYQQQPILSVVFLAVCMAVLFLLWLLINAFVNIVFKQFERKQVSVSQRLAVLSFLRHKRMNILQLSVMSLSFALLLVLIFVQQQLFSQWQAQSPEDRPNFFVINIQQQQLLPVRQWLEGNNIDSQPIYPMVRGRLIEINGKSVREFVSKEKLKRSGVDRELNLSWSDNLPEANTVTKGLWFDELHSNQGIAGHGNTVSVEQRLADRLGIGLNDTLTFQVMETRFSTKVSSIREVDWNSMKPNFYMLFEKSQLAEFDRSYITSFYLPEDKDALRIELIKKWPTLVLLDIDHIIKQVRTIVNTASQALQWVLLFVLLAGVLLQIIVLQSHWQERLQDNALLRVLGATRSVLGRAQYYEWLIFVVISGAFAAFLAQILVLAVQAWFSLPLQSLAWYLLLPFLAAFLLLLPFVFYLLKAATAARPAALLQ